MKEILRFIFRKDQDWRYLLTKILVLFFVFVNLVSALFSPAKEFLLKHNVHFVTLWFLGFILVIQLDKIISELKLIRKKVFRRNVKFSVEDVYKKIANYQEIYIFYGLKNKNILNKLLFTSKISSQKKIEFYINIHNLKLVDINKLKKRNYSYFIADVPNSYCTIFYLEQGVLKKIETINQIGNRGKHYSIEIQNDEDLLSNYFKSYSNTYLKNSRKLTLSNPLLVSLISSFQEDYDSEIESLFEHKNLRTNSREKFFRYAINLVENAKTSFKAVDFIPPQVWINDYFANKYGKAHSININVKTRIHVFEKDKLKSQKENYLYFIELMSNVNVKLYFYDDNFFNYNSYEKRGSLVVDDSCAIVAINPDKGAQFGIMEFNQNVINQYNKRFVELLSNSINVTDFTNLLNSL